MATSGARSSRNEDFKIVAERLLCTPAEERTAEGFTHSLRNLSEQKFQFPPTTDLIKAIESKTNLTVVSIGTNRGSRISVLLNGIVGLKAGSLAHQEKCVLSIQNQSFSLELATPMDKLVVQGWHGVSERREKEFIQAIGQVYKAVIPKKSNKHRIAVFYCKQTKEKRFSATIGKYPCDIKLDWYKVGIPNRNNVYYRTKEKYEEFLNKRKEQQKQKKQQENQNNQQNDQNKGNVSDNESMDTGASKTKPKEKENGKDTEAEIKEDDAVMTEASNNDASKEKAASGTDDAQLIPTDVPSEKTIAVDDKTTTDSESFTIVPNANCFKKKSSKADTPEQQGTATPLFAGRATEEKQGNAFACDPNRAVQTDSELVKPFSSTNNARYTIATCGKRPNDTRVKGNTPDNKKISAQISSGVTQPKDC